VHGAGDRVTFNEVRVGWFDRGEAKHSQSWSLAMPVRSGTMSSPSPDSR
jgi:hypothetical protein